MITSLTKYENEYVETQLKSQMSPNGFFYERKMMILESNWDSENVFNQISVYPFLANISNILCDKQSITVGHRHFDSVKGLQYYTEFPDGKIWNDPSCWGTSVFYIAAHGAKGSLLPTMEIISKEDLLESLRGFEAYPNIIIIGGCGVFEGKEGKKFGYDLLESSGTRAIFGYESKWVDFIDSTVIDLLLLYRFFVIHGENPFDRLPDIYNSVLLDYKPAKALGLSLFLA